LRVLVLDDNKIRLKIFKRNLIGAVIVCTETVKDCIKELRDSEANYDYLFLDHDLDGKIYVPSGPGTGYEVAQWLKNNPHKKPNKIILHSCNEEGIKKMLEELPEASPLIAVFMMDFNISDLPNLDVLYSNHLKRR
jgi:CheY-like chemotaxis protein